eukprot:1152982-Pelagomonas_calceolata.AAC.5
MADASDSDSDFSVCNKGLTVEVNVCFKVVILPHMLEQQAQQGPPKSLPGVGAERLRPMGGAHVLSTVLLLHKLGLILHPKRTKSFATAH